MPLFPEFAFRQFTPEYLVQDEWALGFGPQKAHGDGEDAEETHQDRNRVMGACKEHSGHCRPKRAERHLY